MSERPAEVVELPLRFRERRFGVRTLDERLTVRWPRLYAAVARRVLALSPRSRLRRHLVARRTMGGYQGMNRGDVDVLLAIYAPDVIVRFHQGGTMPPDLGGEYVGHAGFRDFWARWLDSWESFRFEPRHVVDAGDSILVTVAVHGVGRASGLATETTLYEVFRFRDGLIVSHEDFVDVDAARAVFAAGAKGGGGRRVRDP